MKDKLNDIFDEHGVAMGCLTILLAVVLILGIAFGGLCFEAWLVMLLWNAVVVELFAVSTLGFWQAFGILLLCHFLFGGAKAVVHHKGE